MTQFAGAVLHLVDAGRVAGASGAAAAGCRSAVPSRVGAGVYRLTFPFPLDKPDMIMTISQVQDNAIGGTDNKTHVHDFDVAGDPAIIEVRTFEASTAAPVDMSFDWKLEFLGAPNQNFVF